MTDFALEAEKIDFNLLTEPQAHNLLRMLAKYPEIVLEAHKTLEPCTVVQYCFELCHVVSAAYEALYVKGREQPLAHARLALYVCARVVLGNALRLVGLTPLERM